MGAPSPPRSSRKVGEGGVRMAAGRRQTAKRCVARDGRPVSFPAWSTGTSRVFRSLRTLPRISEKFALLSGPPVLEPNRRVILGCKLDHLPDLGCDRSYALMARSLTGRETPKALATNSNPRSFLYGSIVLSRFLR